MFIRLTKRCYSTLLDSFLEIFVGAVNRYRYRFEDV